MSEETQDLTKEVRDTTTVDQIEVNIDELFGTPGAESIMLPADDETSNKNKSVFSKENIDTTFLDKPATPQEKEAAAENKAEVEETIAELDDLISQEEDAGNKGRPKVDKSGLYELAQRISGNHAQLIGEDKFVFSGVNIKKVKYKCCNNNNCSGILYDI